MFDFVCVCMCVCVCVCVCEEGEREVVKEGQKEIMPF